MRGHWLLLGAAVLFVPLIPIKASPYKLCPDGSYVRKWQTCPTPSPTPTPTPSPTPTPTPAIVPLPTGYGKCADENGSCVYSGTTTLIYYGAGTSYYALSLPSPVACNNTTYGDPDPGVVKACYAPTADLPAPTPPTPTPTPTPTPAPTPSGNWAAGQLQQGGWAQVTNATGDNGWPKSGSWTQYGTMADGTPMFNYSNVYRAPVVGEYVYVMPQSAGLSWDNRVTYTVKAMNYVGTATYLPSNAGDWMIVYADDLAGVVPANGYVPPKICTVTGWWSVNGSCSPGTIAPSPPNP